MSYDIELVDPVSKQVIEFEFKHQIAGGNMEIGGTNRAWLNITYNYSEDFYRVIEGGIRSLYGKSGAEAIPILSKAISQLKDDVDDDYWKATEGNAKRALYGLLAFAQMRPDGIFKGD